MKNHPQQVGICNCLPARMKDSSNRKFAGFTGRAAPGSAVRLPSGDSACTSSPELVLVKM